MRAGPTLLGTQEPTYATTPVVVDLSTAEDALELAAAAGLDLLPWQAEQVRRALAHGKRGEWAAPRHGLCVPRQSGKGVVLEVVVLAKAVLLGERVLWTAHEVRTMQESFRRFRSILEGTPSLAVLVKGKPRTANGQESIEFTNGAQVKFSARSASAQRGLGFRTIVFDEAQELDYTTLGAVVPTLSGQGDARTQQIYVGTAPYSRKGEAFTDMRSAAHNGTDPRLSWSEWSCDAEDRTDDPLVWAKTNPSLGVIVHPDKVRDELNTLASRPDVFRRERLGEWGRTGDTVLALDPAGWATGTLPRSSWPARHAGYRPAFIGADTTYGNEHAVAVEAVPLEDGRIGLDVLDSRPGVDWVPHLFALARDTDRDPIAAYDPLRTGDLAPDLTAVGVRDRGNHRRIHAATGRDLTLACDALVRMVGQGIVLHDDPRLDAAAAIATRSTFDDGRGWKLIAGEAGDVSPLIAAALALNALRQQRPTRTNGRGRRATVLQ